MLECTILGKHGPYPEPGGACSGYLIRKEDSYFLFDMGAGAFGRLMENIDPSHLEAVFISHWHSDHCSDLLIFDYYLRSLQQEGRKPITLYGPRDETSIVFNHVIISLFFQFFEAHPADEIVT
ncbi:MAG: MBL fold metallo-hydrolase, partial [Clostridiales bacterium]|nr:MBL fold metallo-hydrolase [Clostridiales bacterium]